MIPNQKVLGPVRHALDLWRPSKYEKMHVMAQKNIENRLGFNSLFCRSTKKNIKLSAKDNSLDLKSL